MKSAEAPYILPRIAGEVKRNRRFLKFIFGEFLGIKKEPEREQAARLDLTQSQQSRLLSLRFTVRSLVYGAIAVSETEKLHRECDRVFGVYLAEEGFEPPTHGL